MDRGVGDVGAVVENVLRAVAVMIVDVEDRDALLAAAIASSAAIAALLR